MKPRFFKTRADLRAWFERNHQRATELWVGFYKKASGKPSVSWPESVDEAMCFGWIDGIRKGLDDDSYANRFTPRKPASRWSARNVQRARELIEAGLMRPRGLAAFEARQENRTGMYSYEQRPPDLPPRYERRLRSNARGWTFWRSVAPSYRQAATWWVSSAKREETRDRRLTALIESSARGERFPPLAGPRSAG